MEDEVSPVDHKRLPDTPQDNKRVPPWQNEREPFAAITGAEGNGSTETTTGAEVAEHPELVTVTEKLPLDVTLIEEVVALFDQRLPDDALEVSVTDPP